ncbi:M61 metallopeptidase family protein [Novosphingobium terrae]|uniref:hypothetical protein n=1 Tax=Novosphingobium terrae TaxID=2726189 RepID=UPI001981A552|nr:hypothetical protein [Novosphingobium terrae]
MRIPAPHAKAGDALLKMPKVLVGLQTASYEASAIEASDDIGPVPLSQMDEAPGPSGTYRDFLTSRPTQGDVTVRYASNPRSVDSETRNGPLFDLRAQAGGLIGAGVYFFALPADERIYNIRLHWDLTKAPAGTRGIWSFGEGDQSVVGPASQLAFSFYAAGAVKSAAQDNTFGFYWLQEPPFDPAVLGKNTHRLFTYMARFFHDAPGVSYRVFARANPYPSGGGTSLAHSFMFGYGAKGETIGDGTDMLIAHEMAHTWPDLSEESDDHPAVAWYSEGTAEFYSVLLSLRAGTIDFDRFLAVINAHARDYYTNPFRALSNEAAGKLFWSDARAQRVPYGRGFMYLAKVNGQLKAKSGGKRSVDDLVLEVLERQRHGEKVGVPQWIAMVVRELGPGSRQDYLDMVEGKTIVPSADSFGPCLKLVRTSERPFDLGFDDMRLGVVKDLRADSAAAAAGLHEGDSIVSLTPRAELQAHEEAIATAVIRRDGRDMTFRFNPRRPAVEGWTWVRAGKAPLLSCGL